MGKGGWSLNDSVGPWTGGGHRDARSPSSSSSAWWPRFGALARHVNDREKPGRLLARASLSSWQRARGPGPAR